MVAVSLPPWVQENYEREQLVDDHIGKAHALNDILKAHDPNLSLVWGSERALDPRVIPARWHVKAKGRGAPDLYIPITGPNGEYREPDANVYHELQAKDLWNDRVAQEVFAHSARRRAESVRREALNREQRIDTLAEDIRAAKRVFGDSGLTKRKMLK